MLQPDLAIAVNAPYQVRFGETITYDITIGNQGTAIATSVTVTDVLPPGTSFVSADINGTACTVAGNLVSCALGDLPVQGGVTGKIILATHRGGPINNEIDVANGSGDRNLQNNSALAYSNVLDRIFATGTDEGNRPSVNVYDALTGALRFSFDAYDPRFLGGARVAVTQIDKSGVPDVVVAPGPGGGPDVRIFDGDTGALVKEFYAYDPRFSGGVYLAIGEQAHTPFCDSCPPPAPIIITGAGPGGGPHVKVFDADTLEVLRSFYAYDANMTVGVRVAAGPVNALSFGTSISEIITAPGPGAKPEVRIFNSGDSSLRGSFLAYEPSFLGGVYVAWDNQYYPSGIVTGPGAGRAPEVKIFSMQDASVLQDFQAFDPSFTGGVRVSALQEQGPTVYRTDIITAAGPDGQAQVKIFASDSLAVLDSFHAYDSGAGVFVGGERH
jgi:uncharacterized repeat protein (TIGR01451 family)